MKRLPVGERCNVTGENIFDKKHLEVCIECQYRVWVIKHPKLEAAKWWCYGILVFGSVIGCLTVLV